MAARPRTRGRGRGAPPPKPHRRSIGELVNAISTSIILRRILFYLGLIALTVLSYLFASAPRGRPVIDDARAIAGEGFGAASQQVGQQVHIQVMSFLSTPTPTLVPTLTPTPANTATWTPAPTLTPLPADVVASPTVVDLNPALTALPQKEVSKAQMDRAGQMIRDYLSAISNGNRTAALGYWQADRASAAQAIIDSALGQHETDKITSVREDRVGTSGDTLLITVVGDITVSSGKTYPGVKQVYRVTLSGTKWGIVARVQ